MDITMLQDYLTKILNRLGLYQAFEELDEDSVVSVLFFDIDNFKTVNDVYGHKKGDELLIEFANVLNECTPERSIVARLGGDEFVAIIPLDGTKEFISVVTEKILKATRNLKNKDKAFDVISCSVGILRGHAVKEGLDVALSFADKAMYFAKEQGKDSFSFYEDFEEQISYEKYIEKDVVAALEEGRIFVKYHPVLNLQSSRIVSTEACCIWKLPDGTVIGRSEFRPILVKNEYINELDMFIFEQVCKDYGRIKDINTARNKLCVQFSHLMLLDEQKMDTLVEILGKYGVSADCFEINFDESIFSGRLSVTRIVNGMNRLKGLGFSIALSHFGEDCSSVKYLKKLPLSAVKLDGDFIIESIKDTEGKRTLKSIIKLGKGFKYTIVGCMADNSERARCLADCGCDAATGAFFSDKLTISELRVFLEKMQQSQQDIVSFHFNESFASDHELFVASSVSEDVKLGRGIAKGWGAVMFPGGSVSTNYVKLPLILGDGDYSFSMWVNPAEVQNWVAALYIRYQNGFAAFMPNISGGRSMYRVKGDNEGDNIWHDAMASAFSVGRWTFTTVTYDAFTSTLRFYVDGVLGAMISDVPQLGEVKELWLGADVFQNSFCGRVSALKISSSTWESEEVKKQYEEYKVSEEFAGNEMIEETELTEVEVHDPAIYEDPVTGKFYIYGTGAQGFVSSDLVHWKSLGTVVEGVLTESREHTNSDAIWAPDIVKVGDEYRLYCSNSSWGVRQSAIFMAVADSAAGPFVPKALVHKTNNTDSSVNCIDANIIEDAVTGEQYMVYGSFWGGIRLLKLDKTTGLALEGQGEGICIAVRPQWNEGAIEGPYIIYHPKTQYYYLFVSYGSLKCDYNIRVGRSKCITGPYLDYNGKEMTDISDDSCSVGLMVSCGYRYLTGQAYMGPGHNSVLLRENGDMFLVSHIRKLAFNTDPGPGLLQIRKMIMTPDGWPIAMGQPYNAETLLVVRDELLLGDYERIELRPTIPQGVSHAHPMKLLPGGRLEMASVIGTWERVGECEMKLSYGPITEFVHFEKGLDKEMNRTTVVMCGLTSKGICTWAKKEEMIY